MVSHRGQAGRLRGGQSLARRAEMRWLVRFLFKALIGFVGLSLLLVLLFRFVPVPVTATMLRSAPSVPEEERASLGWRTVLPRATQC